MVLSTFHYTNAHQVMIDFYSIHWMPGRRTSVSRGQHRPRFCMQNDPLPMPTSPTAVLPITRSSRAGTAATHVSAVRTNQEVEAALKPQCSVTRNFRTWATKTRTAPGRNLGSRDPNELATATLLSSQIRRAGVSSGLRRMDTLCATPFRAWGLLGSSARGPRVWST